MNTGIVAEFFKDSGGRIRMNSMTVFHEERSAYDRLMHVHRSGYDVDWSRGYQSYIFHNSSGGGSDEVEVSGIYFVSGDVKVKEKPCQFVDARDNPPWRSKRTKAIRQRNRTRRLKALPKHIDLETGEDLYEWMVNHAFEQDAVYCSICRDYFPGDSLCKHCWWCDKQGDYSTPGERCDCKDRRECNGWDEDEL